MNTQITAQRISSGLIKLKEEVLSKVLSGFLDVSDHEAMKIRVSRQIHFDGSETYQVDGKSIITIYPPEVENIHGETIFKTKQNYKIL